MAPVLGKGTETRGPQPSLMAPGTPGWLSVLGLAGDPSWVLKHKPETGGVGETKKKCLLKTINYIPLKYSRYRDKSLALQGRQTSPPQKSDFCRAGGVLLRT